MAIKYSKNDISIQSGKATISQIGFESDKEVYRVVTTLSSPDANLRFDAEASTITAEQAASTVLYLARVVRREKVREEMAEDVQAVLALAAAAGNDW